MTPPPIRPTHYGKCPHCSENLRFEKGMFVIPGMWRRESDLNDCEVHGAREIVRVIAAGCPSCGKPIVSIAPKEKTEDGKAWMAYPRSAYRKAPKEVRDEDQALANDYEEAALLLTLSPKASAAISRRCLQTVLIRKANQNPDDSLATQIQNVLNSPVLPSYIHENLDAIRQYGNFAAHPLASKVTGAIVDVETGEAEYCLDILDDLFDHYYVKPTQSASKRAALSAKLKESGKPPMK